MYSKYKKIGDKLTWGVQNITGYHSLYFRCHNSECPEYQKNTYNIKNAIGVASFEDPATYVLLWNCPVCNKTNWNHINSEDAKKIKAERT